MLLILATYALNIAIPQCRSADPQDQSTRRKHMERSTADELAAIGRELSILQDDHAPDTAELTDRLQRAIDGEGADWAPDVRVRGFRWG